MSDHERPYPDHTDAVAGESILQEHSSEYGVDFTKPQHHLLWHAEGLRSSHLSVGRKVQPQPFCSSLWTVRSSAVRVVASQPPCRSVESSRRLNLVVEVEGAQVLGLSIVRDITFPPAVLLGPAHTHELRRPLHKRRRCCRSRLVLLRDSERRTCLLCPLDLPLGGEVQR